MRVYVIGDIHGHLDRLTAAHGLIAADRRRTGDTAAPIIHLGDLIDRGPESAEVIDYLARGPVGSESWITLRGNHDDLFSALIEDTSNPEQIQNWLRQQVGGRATLESYGIAPDADEQTILRELRVRVPSDHRAFLAALPASHTLPGLIFVHAGIRPGVAFDAQDRRDLIWIRNEFLTSRKDHGALVVHGHTPVDKVTLYSNRLNMDSGAAYGGPVSAAVIEDGEVAVLTEHGREVLHPVAPPEP